MNMDIKSSLHALEAKLDQVLTALQANSCMPLRKPNPGMSDPIEHHGELVSLEQAACELGISPGHLRNLQWAEKVPHYRMGVAVRFDVAELRRYFRRTPRSKDGRKKDQSGA